MCERSPQLAAEVGAHPPLRYNSTGEPSHRRPYSSRMWHAIDYKSHVAFEIEQDWTPDSCSAMAKTPRYLSLSKVDVPTTLNGDGA